MFTDRQAGSYWITGEYWRDCPSPVGLGIMDESSGVARSRRRLRRTQAGYDFRESYSTTHIKPFVHLQLWAKGPPLIFCMCLHVRTAAVWSQELEALSAEKF